MDKDILEFLYNSGKMPFRYYAQQNGKSPQENYKISKQILHERLNQQEAEKQIKEQITEEIEKIFLSLMKR